MKNKTKKIIIWTPRTLTILFATFISIFALDVFVEYSFPEVLVALFMHLIPTFVLVALLLVAWKWELWGGIGFFVLGIFFTVFFDTYNEIISFLIISLPVFIVGILFLVSWKINKKKN